MLIRYSQHDAHEFLSDLIVSLRDEMASILSLLTQSLPHPLSFDDSPAVHSCEGDEGEAVGLLKRPSEESTPSTEHLNAVSRLGAGTLTTKQRSRLELTSRCDRSLPTAEGGEVAANGGGGVAGAVIEVKEASSEDAHSLRRIIEKMATEHCNMSRLLLPTARRLQSMVDVLLRCTTCGHERNKQVARAPDRHVT